MASTAANNNQRGKHNFYAIKVEFSRFEIVKNALLIFILLSNQLIFAGGYTVSQSKTFRNLSKTHYDDFDTISIKFRFNVRAQIGPTQPFYTAYSIKSLNDSLIKAKSPMRDSIIISKPCKIIFEINTDGNWFLLPIRIFCIVFSDERCTNLYKESYSLGQYDKVYNYYQFPNPILNKIDIDTLNNSCSFKKIEYYEADYINSDRDYKIKYPTEKLYPKRIDWYLDSICVGKFMSNIFYPPKSGKIFYKYVFNNFTESSASVDYKVENYEPYFSCVENNIKHCNYLIKNYPQKNLNSKIDSLRQLISNQIKIFPNPFYSNIQLELNICNSSNFGIEIFDISGKLEYQTELAIENEENPLNILRLEEIKSGVHFLKMSYNDFSVYKKIVKF